MRTANKKKTDNIEVVETYNIALALRRIENAPSYDSGRVARALVHGIGMSHVIGMTTQKGIREALGLP